MLVTGAVLDDGRQMLIALPADRPGVRRSPLVSAGGAPGVMHDRGCAQRQSRWMIPTCWPGPRPTSCHNPGAVGTAGLETSALALGQARAALSALIEFVARPDRPGRATGSPLRKLADLLGPTDRPGARRAGCRFPRPDPHAGERLGSPLDAGLSHRHEGHRFPPDRARPAVGAPGSLLPGLVVPHARCPGRHPRPRWFMPGMTRCRCRGLVVIANTETPNNPLGISLGGGGAVKVRGQFEQVHVRW